MRPYETEWCRISTELRVVKQLLWHATATSTLTGETVPLHYYQNCHVTPEEFENEAAREAKVEAAWMSFRFRLDEAKQGWAYLPAYDRVGMIVAAVTELLLDGDDVAEQVHEAVSKANEEYERRWQAAARLGAEWGDGFGWRIPIQPINWEAEG